MHIALSDEYVEVRLAKWQKLLGLLRDIRVARTELSDVRVVEDPLREAMSSGIKVGLRLPWLYYVARTIHLDEAFVVRRGVPGLSFAVDNGTALRRVLVSTHDADALVQQLQPPDAALHAARRAPRPRPEQACAYDAFSAARSPVSSQTPNSTSSATAR